MARGKKTTQPQPGPTAEATAAAPAAEATEAPVIRCAHTSVVDPKTLKPHPANPNTHPPAQLKMFATILAYQGWRRPITVSKRSGFVTKGHGALETALMMGWSTVPVDEQEYDSNDAELADIVADNTLQRMSELDNVKLTELLVQLDSADGFNLELTGLEGDTVDKLLDVFERDAEKELGPPPAGGIQPGSAISSNVGDAGAAEGGDAKPTRMVQLFFDEAQHGEFMRIAEFFKKELQVTSLGEALLDIMKSAFEAHTAENGEPERGATDDYPPSRDDAPAEGEE